MICKKCLRDTAPEEGKIFETDTNESYFFCKNCLKTASKQLGMKKNKTKGDKQLLTDIRKYLNEEIN